MELMNRILITLFFLIGSIFLLAQNENLSEQELKVIKSYQFDLTESNPILSNLSLDLPKLEIETAAFKVDLLPVKLEDVTYGIMPLAHQPSESKFYKGWASAAFGSSQILDLEASFRHQVPNYFMYGIDVEYSNINDQNTLSKDFNEKKALGFLRYYLKPSFWFEYQALYSFSKLGVFGFNQENVPGIIGGEIKEENYRQNYHQITLFKRLKKINTDFNLKNSLFTARNTKMHLGENVLHNHLNIATKFSSSLSLNISSNHKRQISTVNDSNNKYLWNNRLNISFTKPHIGFKIEGLFSLGQQTNILPGAEFYLNGKAHSLTAFYRNRLNFNSFYETQNEINLIYIPSFSTSITEVNSYGLKYDFDIKDAHGLNMSASFINKKNDQIWINTPENLQYFSFQLLDYSYYNLELGYHIHLHENLKFNQSIEYKLLQDIDSKDITHLQKYNVKSSVSYSMKRINLAFDYLLGDQVAFTKEIEGYSNQSDYQHDLRFELKYSISDAVQVSLIGIDLLNNRFEAFTGYKDFGRRGKLKIRAKF